MFLDESKSASSLEQTELVNVFAASILRDLHRSQITHAMYNKMEFAVQLIWFVEPIIANEAHSNNICLSNNIAPFAQTDKDVITEFLLVMQPVAACLNRFQSEDEAYKGVRLLTLYVLR